MTPKIILSVYMLVATIVVILMLLMALERPQFETYNDEPGIKCAVMTTEYRAYSICWTTKR